MFTGLRHRSRRRKGVAAVLGTIIAVGILFSTIVPLLLYIQNTNALYNQAVNTRRLQDQDRLAEQFTVTLNLTAGSNLAVSVTNNGPLSILVQYILLSNSSGYPIKFKVDAPLPLTLAPGASRSNIDLGVPYLSGSYSAKVVTSRGNYRSGMYVPPTPSSSLFSTGSFQYLSQTKPQGPFIVGGGDSNNFYAFSGSSNTPLWSFSTGGNVISLAMSGDSKTVAAGSADGKLYVVNRTSGTAIRTYNIGDTIQAVSLSYNGTFVAAGTNPANKTVFLFKVTSSLPVWKYQAGDQITSVSISKNSSFIAAGSADKKVYYFDFSSGIPRWTASYAAQRINSVDVSDDGSKVVAGSDDKSIYLIKGSDGSLLWSSSAPTAKVNDVNLSGDGSFVIAGSNDKTAYFVAASNGALLFTYDTSATGGPIQSVAFSADGGAAFIGGGKTVYFFGRASVSSTWTFLWSYTTGDTVNFVFLPGDAGFAAAVSADKKLYYWLLPTTFSGVAPPFWSYSDTLNVRAVGGNHITKPQVVVKNNGGVALVLSVQSRLLYVGVTNPNNTYTGALFQVMDSSGKIYSISPNFDSNPIPPSASVTLLFNTPGDVQTTVPSGTYNVYLRLIGYDQDGRQYTQTVQAGEVSF